MNRKTVALALSGGGARSLAHIGVLKAFQRHNLPIDAISGTSMGAIIAAAYALGIPLDEIEALAGQMASRRTLIRLLDPSPSRRGLLEGERVRGFLAPLFLDRTFADTRIPLAIPAVDLRSGGEVVFTEGLIFPAVLASMAVPGVFPPVEAGDYRLVDGGVLNNLPVDHARALGGQVVIAVDAQFDPFHQKPWQEEAASFPAPVPRFFLDFYRAELIMIAQITRWKLESVRPDLLLRPPVPLDITMLIGFHRAHEIIAAGEQVVEDHIEEILALCN